MGERTQYTPGTFCWVDLATTDQEGAKAFYSALFGWECDDMPAGDGYTYTMARVGGRDVAAIATQPKEQAEAGVPPIWQSYISVPDVDAAAQHARELGATVHAGPFEVLEAGRMAVVGDLQGAVFMLWQPRRHIGARLVNAPGALVWNELASPDLDASAAFYGGLFGWSFAESEGTPDRYLTIKNGDAYTGGVRTLSPPGMPPHWLVYFGTDDLDAGLAKASELGGTTLAGPMDIGVARIGVVQDPQGAVLALYQGELEP